MITRKLHIKHLSDVAFVSDKCKNYSYAFRKLYKMLEESSDMEFISRFKRTFCLNDIEYRSLVNDVSSFKLREQKQVESKKVHIEELSEVLNDPTSTKREKFKAFNKIAYLKRSLKHETTFGGLSIIRQLSKECNKSVRNEVRISKLRNEFRKNRILPFFVMGEANQKGNRFFDLTHLEDGYVVYKPQNGIKITIEVQVPHNWKEELKLIGALSESKSLSVSIRLSEEFLYLTFDEEVLHGYSVNVAERRKEVADIKKQGHLKETEKALIQEVYKKYYDEQRERKAFGKIADRCIAIDMNPTNIGFCVLDKADDFEVKVIHSEMIDLSDLCKKNGRSSDSVHSKYLTNKRHYELSCIVKRLFVIATHYKCSQFIMEELSFDSNRGMGTKESNRKVKNLWNREFIERLIERRCNESGIVLEKVNPCYSSFIGNIQYEYVDSVNASIEIGRRGLYKYNKGGFYPTINPRDCDTLEIKFGNVVHNGINGDWVEIYKSLKNLFKGNESEFSHRYRATLDEVKAPYTKGSISTYKSRIYTIKFIKL